MDQILQILEQNGYIDDTGAKDLQDLAKTESKSVRRLVIDQGLLSEDDLLAVMAAYQDTEAIDLAGMTIDTDVTTAIPASTARMYNVFPVAADDTSVTLATFDIVDPRISDEMLFTLSKEVRFVFAREKDVMDRIAQYYGDSNESVADMIKALGEGMTDDEALAAGARFGASNQLAANEEQRCISLISRRFYECWTDFNWSENLRPVLLTVRFGAAGKILGYRIVQSSGDTKVDQSVLAAAKRADHVSGLSAEFLKKYPEITIEMKPKRQ